jgi:EF hand
LSLPHYDFNWQRDYIMDQYTAYDRTLEATRVFGMLDTKVNGKLDESELVGPAGEQFKASFANIDTDHDGFIEPKELAAVLPTHE